MSREYFCHLGVSEKHAEVFNGFARVLEKLEVVGSLNMIYHSDSWWEGEDEHDELNGHYYMCDEILVYVMIGDKSFLYEIDKRYY